MKSVAPFFHLMHLMHDADVLSGEAADEMSTMSATARTRCSDVQGRTVPEHPYLLLKGCDLDVTCDIGDSQRFVLRK